MRQASVTHPSLLWRPRQWLLLHPYYRYGACSHGGGYRQEPVERHGRSSCADNFRWTPVMHDDARYFKQTNGGTRVVQAAADRRLLRSREKSSCTRIPRALSSEKALLRPRDEESCIKECCYVSFKPVPGKHFKARLTYSSVHSFQRISGRLVPHGLKVWSALRPLGPLRCAQERGPMP